MGLLDRLRSAVSGGIGLYIDDAGVFCRTQWNFPWFLWATFRIILALYYATFIAYVFINDFIHQPIAAAYFFIYLTNLTVLVVTFYMVVAGVNVVIDREYGLKYHGVEKERLSPIVPSWRHKLQWFLTTVYSNVSILVTIVYWAVLYDPAWLSPSSLYYDLTAHTFPTIFGIIDVLVTPVPVRLVHMVYPIAYALTYMTFTLIYWACGGTDPSGNSGIYPGFLDWDEPGPTTLSVVLCAVGIIACQVVLWGLYRLRMILFKLVVSSYAHGRLDGELGGSVRNGDVPGQLYGTYFKNDGFEET